MNTKHILIAIIIFLLGIVGYLSLRIKPTQPTKDIQEQSTKVGQGNNLGQGKGNNNATSSRKNCLADDCLEVDDLNYPAGELTDDVKTSLLKALDDEYKAHATYEAVIAKLGNVRPFIMIVRSEEQHISSLKALLDKYGVGIPENPYTNKVTVPETLAETCKIGVDAEIANASLYKDELLPNVTDYEDITLVFTNLMNASQEKHLAAFQRCAN